MFSEKEKTLLINLIADKVDLAQRHVKKLNKDYKYYAEERSRSIFGETLMTEYLNCVKEIERQKNILRKYWSGVLND